MKARKIIHPVFHATLLSPYKENDIHGMNFIHPPPELIKGKPEYEVEVIISHWQSGRGHQYLIKWKGYSTRENTWEPKKNLTNTQATLDRYKE